MACMALAVLLGGFNACPRNLLVKRFEFGKLTVIEGATTLSAGVIAVGMAWAGFGVWSLIASVLLSSLSQAVCLMWIVRPKWTFRPDRDVMRRILTWGVPLLGSSLLWRFYDSSDYFVVGRALGPEALGFYTLAFRLATLVNEKVAAVVNRVSFPSFSALQDLDKVAAHWLSITQKLALICFPVLAILIVNADDVILFLLGEKWHRAVEPLRFLCIVGVLRLLTPITNNLLASVGKTKLVFQYSLLTSIVLPPAFYAGCRFGGIRGVGLAWLLLFPPIAAYQIYRALQETRTPATTYLNVLRLPVIAGLVSVASMMVVTAEGPPGPARFILSSLTGGLTYVATVLIGGPEYRGLVVSGWSRLRARA
jgi:PST family polysaccharide transporter